MASLATGAASRRRLALPALDYRAVALIGGPVAALALALVQPVDADYWWHRRTGAYIVEQLGVPRSDPFTFTHQGTHWVDHEWLSQVIMYGIDGAFGYLALFVAFFALGLAAWWIIYRLLRAEGIGPLQSVALSLAPLAIGAMHWRARPAMFTVLLFALFLTEIFAARRGERRQLWHLAALMALWSNLHGGYVIGLVLLALFAASQWWDRRTSPGPSWKHATAVCAVAFLVSGINPYTYEIWLYPLTYFRGDNASLQILDEWQSPNFHEFRSWPLAGLLLIAVIAGANGRRFDPWRSSLALVFGALALQSMRHQTLFALAWAPVVGVALAERWEWWRRERVSTGGTPSLNAALLAGIIAAHVAVVLVSPAGLPLRSAPTDTAAMPFPAAGADWIDAQRPGARIFNEYGWGGYLIDRLYPESRVFIDGRADLHGSLLVDYDRAVRGRDWQRTFDEYAIDTVLLPPQVPLVRSLEEAGWRAVFRDDVQVVLVAP